MLLPLLLAFQQATTPAIVQGPAPVQATTPPSRDTAGYWQQRADYRITARLNEQAQRLEARGTLTYVNRSPDTLRELYLHQYLNAFRPGSKWSEADAREGRVRFQQLRDPAFGYERFTEDPRVDGVAVRPEYPGAPDSTVVRLVLPRPLAPGDSVQVEMAWHARPSTTARRQGRRGRQWDFAHWYPKVAVYDRGGWEPNALQPAGEFYAEFGDFDVTLTLANDQVIGTTGVVVAGDPGWAHARRWGEPRLQPGAYGAATRAGSDGAEAPAGGEKTVRIAARDVHTFAWSVSPDYRYEGGVYVRPAGAAAMRFPTWDTVAVHVLYRPGDERDWGNGQVVQRTANAIAWLERVYGPYAYPQMTVLHRLDGGGTEFPMMQMNGSASQGLILHEGGHIYSYGILANNEWRSGWMDEGLTSYQTSWAQGLTRIERARGGAGVALPVQLREPPRARGYAGLGLRPTSGPDAESMDDWRMAVQGIAEPIGTRASRFRDFGTYNSMIYSRAEMMYGALRDAIGDTAFTAFLQDYYARWGLRHVDEPAMRASAERASGKELDWFFQQWVHEVGLVDYALLGYSTRRDGDAWVTRARVARRGTYRHPMPVGVRTASGWTIVRTDPVQDRQTVEIRTIEEPREVRLDPLRTTEDWYRPNDEREGWWIFKGPRRPLNRFDWPLLDQASADRALVLWSPLAWYGQPGDAAVGVRLRGSYRGLVDRGEAGIALYTGRLRGAERCPLLTYFSCESDPALVSERYQWYAVSENPYWGSRPVMGLRFALAELDGISLVEVRKRWEHRRFAFAPSGAWTRELGVRYTRPFASELHDERRWGSNAAADLGAAVGWRGADVARTWRPGWRAEFFGGTRSRVDSLGERRQQAFGMLQFETSILRRDAMDRWTTFARAWGGWATEHTPRERVPGLGTRSPTELFLNHLVRPRDAALFNDDVQLLVPGGAGLRGYDARVPAARLAALNVEQARRVRGFRAGGRLGLFATAFGNVATPLEGDAGFDALVEAGLGLALRGPLFDRNARLRLDVPLWISEPDLAFRQPGGRATTFRFALATGDLW